MIKLLSPLIFVGWAFLAELPEKPDSVAIGAWIVSGAAVLHIVKTALDTYKAHFKEHPDPQNTYAKQKDVKEQLEAVEARSKERAAANAKHIAEMCEANDKRHVENSDRLGTIDEKLERNFNAFQGTHRTELSGVHERINRVAEELSGIRGEMKHVAASADKAANSAVVCAEAARGAIQAAAEVGRMHRS